MDEDKRDRANRIGNSLDAPNADDTYWLVSEAIGAWNRVDGLLAEVERLRAAIARHLEQAAQDDYHAMHPGHAPRWADLPDAERAVYRGAVAADFWREP